MEATKFPLIYLISYLCLFGSCAKSNKQTLVDWHQYQVYDLVYNDTLYAGVCLVLDNPDRNDPKYIVYEVNAIKEYYERYGIDTLLNEFVDWHYNHIDPTDWTLNLTHQTIPWNTTLKKYIIYLALRNNYVVCMDDESGYLRFEK